MRLRILAAPLALGLLALGGPRDADAQINKAHVEKAPKEERVPMPHLDPDNPDPGRVTIRRLNREEYKNAVYDLLGVESAVWAGFGIMTILFLIIAAIAALIAQRAVQRGAPPAPTMAIFTPQPLRPASVKAEHRP